MAATKAALQGRVDRIVKDKQDEMLDRLDDERRRLGLEDEEFRDLLTGFVINLRDAWDEYVEEGE